jgi:N-acetylneuraminate synthase
MDRHVMIGSRRVGPGEPCFVIAEAGVNHNGDLTTALRLVDVAAEIGADAVKFQTFKADKLVTAEAPQAAYQRQNMGRTQSQLEMLRRLELSTDAHVALVERCRRRGITFLSTPFDESSADLLDTLGVPAFKIPSGEVTNLPLLAHIARFGKAMIVSTGMCRLSEVEAAVAAIEETGLRDMVLLHCVSNYPAAPSDVNLRAMHTMQAAFNYPVGYSDHTLGEEVGLASVALGACMVEKHFTLDCNMPGPDHRASLEPDELEKFIRGLRNVEAALGNGRKVPAASELDTAAVARKSLVAACDIAEGDEITENVIAIRRPGTGLPPAMRNHLLHRTARRAIPAGTLISLEMVA